MAFSWPFFKRLCRGWMDELVVIVQQSSWSIVGTNTRAMCAWRFNTIYNHWCKPFYPLEISVCLYHWQVNMEQINQCECKIQIDLTLWPFHRPAEKFRMLSQNCGWWHKSWSIYNLFPRVNAHGLFCYKLTYVTSMCLLYKFLYNAHCTCACAI